MYIPCGITVILPKHHHSTLSPLLTGCTRWILTMSKWPCYTSCLLLFPVMSSLIFPEISHFSVSKDFSLHRKLGRFNKSVDLLGHSKIESVARVPHHTAVESTNFLSGCSAVRNVYSSHFSRRYHYRYTDWLLQHDLCIILQTFLL